MRLGAEGQKGQGEASVRAGWVFCPRGVGAGSGAFRPFRSMFPGFLPRPSYPDYPDGVFKYAIGDIVSADFVTTVTTIIIGLVLVQRIHFGLIGQYIRTFKDLPCQSVGAFQRFADVEDCFSCIGQLDPCLRGPDHSFSHSSMVWRTCSWV